MGADQKFQIDFAAGNATLAAWGSQSGAKAQAAAPSIGHASSVGFVDAEMLAANFGVVPTVPTSQGPGIILDSIGYARGLIDAKTDERVAIPYLGYYQAIRQMNDSARPVGPIPTGAPEQIGIVPIIIGVIVVGLIGLGFYTAHEYFETDKAKKQLEIDGERARQVAIADQAIKAGIAGVPPGSPTWKILETLAQKELTSGEPSFLSNKWPWAVGGGVLALGATAGITYAVRKNRRRR